MKVKVAQSWPTLYHPTDCGPPGSSVRGILQARTVEWVAISFSREIVLTQGLNPSFPYYRQILYHLRSLGQKDPQRRKWQPTPVFLPKNFHEQ